MPIHLGRWTSVVVIAAAVGIPLAIVAVLLLRRARIRRGIEPGWALRASIAEVGMVVGTAPWLWMLMTPAGHGSRIQLVPFRDLAAVIAGPEALVQLGGNLAVFVALGAFAPMRVRLAPAAAVPIAVLSIGIAASLVVETLQFALAIGRVSSVDDVILNALGAGLASLVTIRWWRARRGPAVVDGD